VEEAGADLLEGMVVNELIYEGEGAARKAVGVKIRGDEDEGDEEFFADVVLLCDGAHSLVTDGARQELKLAPGREPQDFAVGVKETIKLDRRVIEDRFGLNEDEGAALDYIGKPFDQLIGGGFIYTQKEDISIGIAAKIETVQERGLTPNELMDNFKQHPEIKKLLRGGELLEYGAHMIPEGGFNAIGQLAGNGVLICGDAAGLVNMSLYKEGTNHAMESGRLAAETVVEAKAKGDFSAQTLSAYETKMKAGLAVQDLEKYRDLPEILASTPEVLSEYPARYTQLLIDYFTVSKQPKKEIQKQAIKAALKGLPKIKLARDLFRARKLM
jgi:electron transfer flavoprotein-quinone oxidoreductase